MAYFVIMNVGTERLYRKPSEYSDAVYDTERGAKGMCTRLNKKYGNTKQWVVIPYEEFEEKHNPLVVVYNTVTGDGKTPIYIRRSEVGGPCDPSTERYWSM
jgi:hypothetical protein